MLASMLFQPMAGFTLALTHDGVLEPGEGVPGAARVDPGAAARPRRAQKAGRHGDRVPPPFMGHEFASAAYAGPLANQAAASLENPLPVSGPRTLLRAAAGPGPGPGSGGLGPAVPPTPGPRFRSAARLEGVLSFRPRPQARRFMALPPCVAKSAVPLRHCPG